MKNRTYHEIATIVLNLVEKGDDHSVAMSKMAATGVTMDEVTRNIIKEVVALVNN